MRSRSLPLVSAFLLLALPLLALASPVVPGGVLQYWTEGAILDGVTGDPISKAVVTIGDPCEAVTVTTSPNGVALGPYVSEDVAPVHLRVNVDTQGRYAAATLYVPLVLDCSVTGCDPETPCPVSPCVPFLFRWSLELVPVSVPAEEFSSAHRWDR